MSCLAVVPPAIPDFGSGRKYHRLSSASINYALEIQRDVEKNPTEISHNSPYLLMENSTSDLFDPIHSTLYEAQAFTLFEDHILIRHHHFPSIRNQRIPYRGILHVSTDEGLSVNWARGLTLNSIRRSLVLVLTISGNPRKHMRVGFSLTDSTAYSLLKRLVHEANNTPLTIE